MTQYHITRLPLSTIRHIAGGNPMSLLRWQPWTEVEAIRRQLDQAFDDLTHDTVMKSVQQVVRVPAIELTTTATDVVLKAELPGIAAEDLDIQVTRDAIALKGEYRRATQDEHQQIYRTELRYGAFHRVIPLPVEVDNTQAKATFKDGMLTLTLPKYQDERTKAFKVTIGDTTIASATEPTPTTVDQATAPADQNLTTDLWQ
jgi:HSP20 family protein